MKTVVSVLGLSALAMVLVQTGCVERRVVYVQGPPVAAAPAPVVVTQAPPPPRREVAVVSPGPQYVRVPGYWSWQGRWVWVHGSWVIRPRPNVVWIPGHWVHQRHGYVWVQGHWR